MNYYYIIGLTVVVLAIIALVTYFIVYLVVIEEEKNIIDDTYIDITLEVIDGKTLFTTTFIVDYITVDYGDGTIKTFINPTEEILHYYPGNGTYNVRFYNFKNLKDIKISSSESGGEIENEVKLTSIFFSNTIDSLEYLSLYSGKIKSIDLSKVPNLKSIDIGNNELTTLDLSKSFKLESLYCNDNQLTLLDLFNLTDLTEIRCYNNILENLDLSKLNKLQSLVCNDNPNLNLTLPEYKLNLKNIDYSQINNSDIDLTEYINLTGIFCGYNNISTLKIPTTKIQNLNISGNNITSYDFTTFEALTSLYVNDMPSGFTLNLDNNNYSKIIYLSINNSYQDSTVIENIINGFVVNSTNSDGIMDFEGETNDSYTLDSTQDTWKNAYNWMIRLNP
jgi:hypothetical protein